MTIFFVWLLLAAFGFMLSAPLFKKMPDKGLGFAPWIGLFAISYPNWLLGHTGLFQLSGVNVWICFFILLISISVLIKRRKIQIEVYRLDISFVFFHVAIWIFLYAAYVWFYRHNPAIEDIEKFPDLAILTSIYRAEVLPPLNPFASEQVVNYYYFGFYKVATLAHLSAVSTIEIFNPMKAIIFATASSSLSSAAMLILDRLLSNSITQLKNGLSFLGASLSFIMAFAIGNFHTMYHQIIIGEKSFWYPNATRYIENTIHEFPLYSFIIGDLHAHLIALPNAGVTLSLIFLFSEKLYNTNGKFTDIIKGTWPVLLTLCFAFGLSYSSNSWDIFTGLLLVGFLTWFLLRKKSLFHLDTLLNTGLLSVTYVLGAFVAFLPFWVLFEPISSGLGHTPSGDSSPSIQLVTIWLVHASFPILFLCLEKNKEFVFRFLRTVAALGIGLIVFMEYFYFKDIYSGHLRANTLFKIGMQVWIWFSVISSCYFIYVISNHTRWKPHVRIGLTVFFGFLLGSGAIYTKKAVSQYLEVNQHRNNEADGVDFIRMKYPEDYAIIQWFKTNEPKQSNILTAVGDSFSSDGLISAFTGNPTVMTWVTHNWLWHGSHSEPMKPISKVTKKSGVEDSVNERVIRVRAFYQATDLKEAQNFLDLYQIKYVLVTKRERAKYPRLNEEIIRQLGKVVFSLRGNTIYKVNSHGSELL